MPADASALAGFVEAFEQAHARDGSAELARFLPPPGHPLRLDVLRELVCIDLEHGWTRGRPTPVDDYRRRFPELFEAREAVRELLFEDYRLRVQAEEGDLTPPPPGWPAVGEVFEGFRL